MVQVLSAETMTLEQLMRFYQLQLVEEEAFFPEWQTELPELSESEQALLDQIKAGYLNLRNFPPFLENTVNATIVSPLLFVGKFFLPPFHVKLEKSVEMLIDEQETIIKGRIDFLLLKQDFWVTISESKQVAYSVEAGLDQILAYMLATPEVHPVVYGMITSGGSFMFLKLDRSGQPRYATSDIFDVRNRGNQLYSVLRILKRLSTLT